MKFCTLLCVLALSTFLSCTGDNSKSAVKQSLIDFTINGNNATAYKTGENLPADIVADKDYIVAAVNEVLKIKVDFPEDNKLPVLWEVEGSPVQGREVEQTFNSIGFKKIILQVPGHEEVVKFVNIKENLPEPLVEVVENTTEKKTTDEVVKIPPDKNPVPEKKKDKTLPLKKEDKKTTTNPYKDKPGAPTIISGGKPEVKPQVKPEAKTVNTPPKTSTPVSSKPSDFNSSKEEGAKLTEPCGDHTFIDIAQVSFNPSRDVELGSLYVYTSQSGTVDITLLENNSPVDRLSGRSVNKGRAQIRLSTLNYTLRAGRSYTLKVNGSGGVNFANLAKCNAGGGGSILQPSYGSSVAIFNLKFNY